MYNTGATRHLAKPGKVNTKRSNSGGAPRVWLACGLIENPPMESGTTLLNQAIVSRSQCNPGRSSHVVSISEVN